MNPSTSASADAIRSSFNAAIAAGRLDLECPAQSCQQSHGSIACRQYSPQTDQTTFRCNLCGTEFTEQDDTLFEQAGNFLPDAQ